MSDQPKTTAPITTREAARAYIDLIQSEHARTREKILAACATIEEAVQWPQQRDLRDEVTAQLVIIRAALLAAA